MVNALVVADDLTGALDTGHGFAAAGRGVTVSLSGERTGEGDRVDDDVLVVDADSRDEPPERAARAIETIVSGTEYGLLYKKVDSTLRGNVVAEVDAALDASGASVAVVAPAFPGTGRTTREGVHLVEGKPLADAGYGVEESALAAVFAPSRYPTEHLSLEAIAGGAASVRETLEGWVGAEPSIVTCDAVTDDHLRTIADGAAALNGDALYVGSGGLAAHVCVPGEAVPIASPPVRGDGALAVAGSVNERTLDQVAAVPDADLVVLNAAEAVRDPSGVAARTVPEVATRLARRGRAVLTAATGPDDVERAGEAARGLRESGGRERVDAGERIARALSLVAVGVAREEQPRGLFLTGGSVARATLEELDGDRIGLAGEAIGEGIPEGWIGTGPVAGTRVVTKAGGFGSREAIVNFLDRVGTDDG